MMDDKFCEAIYPGTALVCSLTDGHKGNHEAHGREDKILNTWSDSEEAPEELKTLKDLSCLDADHPKLCDDGNGHTYCEKDLKQEAIKHLRDLKNPLPKGEEGWDLDKWIKHFFNITSEDLK